MYENKKFNKLLILKEIKKKNSFFLECLCDCGTIKIIRKDRVVNGITKSCGCLGDKQFYFLNEKTLENAKQKMIGKKFNRLTVLAFSYKDKRKGKAGSSYYVWNCLCDCGKQCEIPTVQLKNNKTKSCGCLQSETILETGKRNIDPIPWQVEANIYIRDTKRRSKNLEFKLSLDDFADLCLGECFYCGEKPSRKPISRALVNFGIKINGINRIDNNKNYIKENCVSCCQVCNFEKSDSDFLDFIKKTEQRYFHLKEKGLIKENVMN